MRARRAAPVRLIVFFGMSLVFGVAFDVAAQTPQCPECDRDVGVFSGHGPASAVNGVPGDNRRVIRVVLNNLGNANDPESWYDPATGHPDLAILTALQEAARAWNTATDQYGNSTGYYFQVSISQTAGDLANADVILKKKDTGGACARIGMNSGGSTPITMSVPSGAPARSPDRLQRTITHELGHPQGLHNATTCTGPTIMAANVGGCSSPLDSSETIGPTSQDIAMSNNVLNNGTSNCTRDFADGEAACDNPCASSDCPGFEAEACATDTEVSSEVTPDAIGEGCFATYEVTTYWNCNGSGCTYLGESWEYLHTECGGTDSCAGACTTCGSTCQNGNCVYTYDCSPIILAVGNSSNYQLTGPDDGVWFDLDGNGVRERMAWTQANEPVAFLVLDRNGNGRIDDGTELFGNHSIVPSGQPVTNGFEALAYYDLPQYGGNADGLVDSRDAIWSSLRLWVDWNHDGASQPSELNTLQHWQVASVSLAFKTVSRQDSNGNVFRLKAPCEVRGHKRFAYDVFFSAKPQKH